MGSIGRKCLNFISLLGHFFLFFTQTLSWIFRPPWYFKRIFSQILDIGYFSLPVVGLTTFFSGMVLALHSLPTNNESHWVKFFAFLAFL